jgi:hypothetical protein
MTRRVLLAIVLGGLMCASLPAAPILFGSFNIAGNITVSNAGFNGCPAGSLCISWTDPPATSANKADIAGSGLTGVFSGIPGFAGNDAANITNLTSPPEIVDGPGFAPQPFMSFNAPGVTTTLLINFIAAGFYTPTQCTLLPAAVGQQCTLPGSLFNFVNNPPPAPAGPQATATWVLSGVTNDGNSTWFGNFTSQFNVPYQTVLAQLQSTGSVTNTYSATITVVPVVPEAGTLSLLGLGLVGLSIKLRRRRS